MKARPSLVVASSRAAVTLALASFTGPLPGVAQQRPIELSGGFTMVGQTTTSDSIRPEVVASFDLFVEVPLGRGRIITYVEANTTPFARGVSRLVGEANTDAGTALDQRRKGRIQVSEVRFVWPIAENLQGHVGLLDATGFIDVSRIANDENLFFLGVPFVNNPTIEFPDYALGLAMDGRLSESVELGVALTSTHGLADNPAVSYSQLLDLGQDGKGVFAGGAVRWEAETARASLGVWMRSAPVPSIDGTISKERNRGAFTVIGWRRGRHSLSGRGGIANGAVSEIRGFAGLTYLWARPPTAIGVGFGRALASAAVPNLADVTQGEAFLRRRLVRDVFATFSVQRIHNSGFNESGSPIPSRLWVGSLRLSAVL